MSMFLSEFRISGIPVASLVKKLVSPVVEGLKTIELLSDSYVDMNWKPV